MTDVEIQIAVYGTAGTTLVLFEATELDFLKSIGARLEDLIVFSNKPGSPEPYRPVEVRRWLVKGRRRNIPVAHLLLGIVGEGRHVRYRSTDPRVASRVLDMRKEFLHLAPAVPEAEKARRRRVKEKRLSATEATYPVGPRFTIENVPSFQLLERGEYVDSFDTEEEAKAAAFDLLQQ